MDGGVRGARAHPIMDVAECQHEIGAAGGCDFLISANELGDDGLAVELGACGNSCLERRDIPLGVAGGGIMAAVLEVWRENFGPIASLSRHDLDYVRIRLHAEKCENFQRVPVAVARLVGVAPLRAIDNRREGGIGQLQSRGKGLAET